MTVTCTGKALPCLDLYVLLLTLNSLQTPYNPLQAQLILTTISLLTPYKETHNSILCWVSLASSKPRMLLLIFWGEVLVY